MASTHPPNRRLSTTFIQNTIDGKMFPAVIDQELFFNDGKDRYEEITEDTPKENVYSGAEIKKDELREAIHAFQRMAALKESKKTCQNEFEISRCHKWSDVEQAMQEAQTEYEERHKGRKMALIDGFLTKVGQSGTTFQAWMDLLPSGGNYSSVICGSFKLIMKAVIGFSKIREMVFTSLAEIPLALDDAQDFLEMNNKWQSLKLHKAFSKLCVAILTAFEDILRWLMENRWKHVIKSLLMAEGYEEQMAAKIKAVKQQSEQVRIQGQVCSYYVLGNIDESVSKQIVQVDGIKVTLEGVKSGVEQLSPRLQNLSSLMKEVAETQTKHGEELVRMKDILNTFYYFLQDEVSKMGQQQLLDEQRKKKRMNNGKKLTSEKLRSCINYDLSSVQTDITHAMGNGRASNGQAQERAQHFMSHSRLKEWLTSPSSGFLLANGNARNDKLSPMSFSCGMLATSLASLLGAIRLTFFCGMHCSNIGDPPQEPGAELLMASLLSQLLASFPWDCDDEEHDPLDFNALFNGGNYSITEVKNWGLEALCSLFLDLVRSLPKDQIVFILVDGINFYEYGERKDGTVFAIKELLELVQTDGSKAICKVLVTSAAQSIAVARGLSPGLVMNLNRELKMEDKGFNVRRRLEQEGKEMGRRGRLFRLHSHPDELEETDSERSEEEDIKSEDGERGEKRFEGSSEEEEEEDGNASSVTQVDDSEDD